MTILIVLAFLALIIVIARVSHRSGRPSPSSSPDTWYADSGTSTTSYSGNDTTTGDDGRNDNDCNITDSDSGNDSCDAGGDSGGSDGGGDGGGGSD